jgi:LmbE family N-acetylglucosaminyl deacetylase
VNRRLVERPAGTRALFVAAHADDVEIGCGGTVLKLIDAQCKVQQAVLTDGRLAATAPDQEEEMARVRAEEARSVAAHLMLPPPELFGVNEREFQAPERLEAMVARLAALLDAFQPDALFVPWFFDQHPTTATRTASSRARVSRAARATSRRSPSTPTRSGRSCAARPSRRRVGTSSRRSAGLSPPASIAAEAHALPRPGRRVGQAARGAAARARPRRSSSGLDAAATPTSRARRRSTSRARRAARPRVLLTPP